MSAFSININAAAIGSESINTVNARDLHAFLEVGRDFSSWIKNRIEVYGFAENVDYVTAENLVRQNGGIKKHGGDRRSVEYLISIDMAKELAMVERTEKGRQVRRYFIECEKALHFRSNDLFLQLARAEVALQSATLTASDAGRTLRYQGRVVKPELRKCIRALIKQLQPELIGLE